MSSLRVLFLASLSFLAVSPSNRPAVAETVTFDDLLASPDSFFNGDTSTVNDDPWVAGDVEFSNSTQFIGFWSGWSYSNVVDPTTPGFTNEYAAAPGGGSDGEGGTTAGGGYAIGFTDAAYFNLPSGFAVQSLDWTNTTYAYLSMRDGDSFAKKFGGPTGTDPDFFRVDLIGYEGLDRSGTTTGTVTLDLADLTSADPSEDVLVNSWQIGKDLTPLGKARSVGLQFHSSDIGPFGINTPTYVAIDNLSLTAVPEPGGVGALLAIGAGLVASRRRRNPRPVAAAGRHRADP
ncbi:DUF4465 domain-containing protein [Roseiconus nitratireducens]|uniref:DUF4465 domain-containing protein n=1 Tax=Roseiconus nitratireducens TaxID=2605748 RepID=A0A5M6DEF2_9BACT|nr:DUF4465 domain-containing protein [Roseiconus nitratireducens]KAA5544672.1 DUF4465 domain-containing protein [Roseiconus nitratireducens]